MWKKAFHQITTLGTSFLTGFIAAAYLYDYSPAVFLSLMWSGAAAVGSVADLNRLNLVHCTLLQFLRLINPPHKIVLYCTVMGVLDLLDETS